MNEERFNKLHLVIYLLNQEHKNNSKDGGRTRSNNPCLSSLAILLFAAKIFAEIFNKLKMPAVLGEVGLSGEYWVTAGVPSSNNYITVIIMVAITTLITPIWLRKAYGKEQLADTGL